MFQTHHLHRLRRPLPLGSSTGPPSLLGKRTGCHWLSCCCTSSMIQVNTNHLWLLLGKWRHPDVNTTQGDCSSHGLSDNLHNAFTNACFPSGPPARPFWTIFGEYTWVFIKITDLGPLQHASFNPGSKGFRPPFLILSHQRAYCQRSIGDCLDRPSRANLQKCEEWNPVERRQKLHGVWALGVVPFRASFGGGITSWAVALKSGRAVLCRRPLSFSHRRGAAHAADPGILWGNPKKKASFGNVKKSGGTRVTKIGRKKGTKIRVTTTETTFVSPALPGGASALKNHFQN